MVTKMAERFYVNCPLEPGPAVVAGPEAHHLTRVCRLHPGNLVYLFNGDGRDYRSTVQSASRDEVIVTVLEAIDVDRELPWTVEIAAPLPKGDRAQFLVEKLTELGVARYVPLRTQRTVVHPGDAKMEKLRRYVVEASKQCGRNILMEVQPAADWSVYCCRKEATRHRYLAHPALEPEAPTTQLPWPVAGAELVFAVGPEGGFTEQEVAQARDQGWRALDLGVRILRVETAALSLAAWANQCLWATT